jgi:hypothetical protein
MDGQALNSCGISSLQHLVNIFIREVSSLLFAFKSDWKIMASIQFYENGAPNIMQMEEIMLNLSEFRHNHHPSGVKILANFIQRGFPV